MSSKPPKTQTSISVSIVEDNAKLLKALSILIGSAPDLRVQSLHADAEDALENSRPRLQTSC